MALAGMVLSSLQLDQHASLLTVGGVSWSGHQHLGARSAWQLGKFLVALAGMGLSGLDQSMCSAFYLCVPCLVFCVLLFVYFVLDSLGCLLGSVIRNLWAVLCVLCYGF